MPPSIITLEKSKFDFANALIIVISQSGKSTDLIECEKKEGSAKYKLGITVELKGQEKPVCVAETLAIAYE